jgi:hypothetical protein
MMMKCVICGTMEDEMRMYPIFGPTGKTEMACQKHIGVRKEYLKWIKAMKEKEKIRQEIKKKCWK